MHWTNEKTLLLCYDQDVTRYTGGKRSEINKTSYEKFVSLQINIRLQSNIEMFSNYQQQLFFARLP